MSATTATGPESIVCSLEWAKKLKEAGWPQIEDSTALWFVQYRSPLLKDPLIEPESEMTGEWEWKLAAPTADEILRQFPLKLNDRTLVIGHSNIMGLAYGKLGWLVRYCGGTQLNPLPAYVGMGETLAAAAADLYYYLAENKLLPPAGTP